MWKNRWFQTSPKKANSLYVSRLNSGQRGRGGRPSASMLWDTAIPCFSFLSCGWQRHVCADGPFTGPQIGVGWGGVGCDIIRQYCKTWCDATLRIGWGWVWYYSSVLQDMMWCYATHGVGWGGLWYHSSLLQDMMWCYATHGVGLGVLLCVSTARHDAMRRYAWGGVGWGGVGCDIIRSQVQGKRNG